jgi:hypothetical protein
MYVFLQAQSLIRHPKINFNIQYKQKVLLVLVTHVRMLNSITGTNPAFSAYDARPDSPTDVALFRSRSFSRSALFGCRSWAPSPAAGGLLMLLVQKRYPHKQTDNAATKHANAIPISGPTAAPQFAELLYTLPPVETCLDVVSGNGHGSPLLHGVAHPGAQDTPREISSST